MKDIVVEIDGKRHRLVENEKAECTGCYNCSLRDLCLVMYDDVIVCERVNEMFGDEDADKFSLCFELDRDEKRRNDRKA